MKSIRILLACSLAAIATIAVVRAEDHCEKKDVPSCGGCPAQKQDAQKCPKDEGCTGDACTKPEKQDAPKTTS